MNVRTKSSSDRRMSLREWPAARSVQTKQTWFSSAETMRCSQIPTRWGVAPEVFDDLGGTAERGLGVDDKSLGCGLAQRDAVGSFVALKLVLIEGRSQGKEELAAEHTGQAFDGDKPGAIPGDPGHAVRSDATARNDAMQMRMEGELLVPGVENGHAADTGTEVGWIGGHCKQCLVNGTKEDAIKEVAVGEGERDQLVGNSKDHMKIGAGQEFPQSRAHPPGAGGALAERAMPIAAGVPVDLTVAALAGNDVPPEPLGLAVGHVPQRVPLTSVEPGEVKRAQGNVTERTYRCFLTATAIVLIFGRWSRGLRTVRRWSAATRRYTLVVLMSLWPSST